MRQWTGWIVAAVLAVVAIVLYSRLPAMQGGPTPSPSVSPSPSPSPKYSKKDRYGLAVVIKQGNVCKVAGGPKNHIARWDEKVTWNVIHACELASPKTVVVELTVTKTAPSPCPSPHPFKQAPPYETKAMNLGDTDQLKLQVKDQGFPNDECAYEYSIGIKDQADSSIDPELDIWP
jgi:hypothetical protein